MTFQTALASFIANHYCQFQNTMNGIWGPYVRAVWGENTPISKLLTGEYGARMFCNRPSEPPTPGFSGGQCPVFYWVDAEIYDENIDGNNSTYTQHKQFRGPIAGFRYSGPPNDPKGVFEINHATYNSQGQPTGYIWETYISAGFALAFRKEFRVTITGVYRVDGQPDNCGEPQPTKPDDDDENNVPYIFPVNIDYTNNEGLNVTVPVVLAFGFAYLDADFNLKVPVTVNFSPNFNFNPTANFNFRADINLGTGDVNFGPPVPPGTPAPKPPLPPKYNPPPTDTPPGIDPTPPPPPPDIPDPEEPDDDEEAYPKVIIGAIVTVNDGDNAKTAGILTQDVNPNVRYPDVGLVSFRIRSRYGGGWTEDIKVKNDRHFIPCPWGGGAVDVRGTARLGCSMTVTPIYGAPDPRFVD